MGGRLFAGSNWAKAVRRWYWYTALAATASSNWLFNHPALAAERRVIALDLPGHGESGKTLQRGGLDELSETVLALLDHWTSPRPTWPDTPWVARSA